MPVPQFIIRLLKLTGWTVLWLSLFVVNMVLLWNFSGIRHRVRIENGSTPPVFLVVVTESGKPELILLREELDGYVKTHPNYSFLLPRGNDELLQEQIVASFRSKFPGGKGYPTFDRQTIDPSHQYIELYMHGDAHDDVYWYEATDKAITPKYYMVFGAFNYYSWLRLGSL